MVFRTGNDEVLTAEQPQQQTFRTAGSEVLAPPLQATRFGGIGLPEPAATEGEERLSDSIMDDILFSPDKTFNPLEQGQIATELLQRLSEPEDTARKFENRMMISSVFGVPLEQVEFMEPTILKELFEDDLISLKERFKKNPVEGGFFKKIGEAVRRGNRNITSDIAVYQAAFENQGDIAEVLSTRAKHQLEETLSPIEGNLISNLFYKSGQIIPGMVRGYWDAIPEALTGMVSGITVAAIAGQAGPQVLLPEEALTVPLGAVTGIKIGLSVGSAHFWYKQGAGSFFAAMMDKNLDPEISRTVAGVAAIPYAIVELLQVSQLTPGLRKGAEDIGRRTMLKVIAQATKTYGKTYTQEVLEEIAQEIIQISAEDIAQFLSENGIDINAQFIQERAARVWTTAKESAQALALLPIPGAAIDVNTGRKQVLTQRRLDVINAKTAEFEAALGSVLSDEVRQEAGLAVAETEAEPEVQPGTDVPDPEADLPAGQGDQPAPDASEEVELTDDMEVPEDVSQAGTGPGGIVLNRLSLLVGVVTFVVLLSAIAGAFIFVVRKPAAEAPKPVIEKPKKDPEKSGNLIYHTLIERYTFSTSLPPLGDRTVAFEYSVAVQIDEADRDRLVDMLDQQQLMLKLQADIRRIISQEEYTKLRTDDLKGVARRVREKLNTELGEEIVQEVIFPIWNVYW